MTNLLLFKSRLVEFVAFALPIHHMNRSSPLLALFACPTSTAHPVAQRCAKLFNYF